MDSLSAYHWLRHQGRGLPELGAYSPYYLQGKENFQHNKEHDAFPKTWYGRSENDVLKFVKRYAGRRILCVGINPRPSILRNRKGFARAAREEEIELAQSLLQDFDAQRGNPSEAHLQAVHDFLQKTNPYFLDQNLYPPVRSPSGNGWHQLYAFPPVLVREHPDIAQRLRKLTDEYRSTFRKELEDLEVKLDSTADLRRMWKIPGTRKPGSERYGRFYATERLEDENLRDYLLSMDLDSDRAMGATRGGLILRIENELPDWFQAMLEKDTQVRQLWESKGKIESADATRSGYDFSLVRTLLRDGHRNLDELATILALRPDGDVQERGKGDQYIRRTIANALLR